MKVSVKEFKKEYKKINIDNIEVTQQLFALWLFVIKYVFLLEIYGDTCMVQLECSKNVTLSEYMTELILP